MPSFVSIAPNNKRKRAAAENANRKIMRKRGISNIKSIMKLVDTKSPLFSLGKRAAVSVPDEEVS